MIKLNCWSGFYDSRVKMEKNKNNKSSKPYSCALKADTVTFTGVGHFGLKSIPGIPCAYCGGRIVTRNEQKYWSSVLSVSKGKKLRYALSKTITNQKFFIEKQMANIIAKQARTNASKNIKEILVSLFDEAEKRLVAEQKKILEQTHLMATELTGATLSRVENDFKVVESILSDNFSQVIFKRKTLLNGFRCLLENETDPHNKAVLEQIMQTLPTLPTSGNSSDAFIVKYSRRSPKEIADRLLEPYLASGEHILPESCSGVSHYSNYLVIHKRCNENRASINFREFLEANPQIVDLIYRHVSAVESKIKRGHKFTSSETYVAEVLETLNRESEGLIDWQKYKELKKKKKIHNIE